MNSAYQTILMRSLKVERMSSWKTGLFCGEKKRVPCLERLGPGSMVVEVGEEWKRRGKGKMGFVSCIVAILMSAL